MSDMNDKLLILADDLTGSLDTGVQLSKKGYEVTVLAANTGIPADFKADVLVINTDTRHMKSTDAYRIISDLVKDAMSAGFRRFYKKTDSGLRGNVGAELSALLKESGQKTLSFVPAWPKMGRITKNGIHYVNGRPLSESIFAKDVRNPVKESRIDRLIHLHADVPVSLNKETEGIAVYDCTSDEEMETLAAKIFADPQSPLIAAGCAGLLEKYPPCPGIADSTIQCEGLSEELIVLSGSMNEVTLKQLQYAEDHNACRVHLPVHKILRGEWNQTDTEQFVSSFLHETKIPLAVIDTLDETVTADDKADNAAQMIARHMGMTAACLIRQKPHSTLMIIGGDTLLGCVKALGIETLTPLKEMAPGTVLAQYTNTEGKGYLITKSGGFGDEQLLVRLQKQLEVNMKKRPIIGITMGDPAGSGPEITVKALSDPSLYERCCPLVIGDAKILEQAKMFVSHPEIIIHPVSDVNDALFEYGTIDVYHLDLIDDVKNFKIGEVSKEGGRAAFESVRTVIELAMEKKIDATVTNALNKEAMNLALADEGKHFDGHTEIYAAYTNTKKYTMMLAHHDFRVVHVSTHVSLREACDRVKKDRVMEVIQLAYQACHDLGIENPKVGVCGLNPHAGENGLFGREEIDEIIPAIKQAREKGIDVIGPLPPDSAFSQMLGGWYDIIVCMYHDQGHIPTKTIGFVYDRTKQTWKAVEGVNITLGLPIIRTSVDHGTDFPHAGKGESNELSLVNAIDYALRMAR